MLKKCDKCGLTIYPKDQQNYGMHEPPTNFADGTKNWCDCVAELFPQGPGTWWTVQAFSGAWYIYGADNSDDEICKVYDEAMAYYICKLHNDAIKPPHSPAQ